MDDFCSTEAEAIIRKASITKAEGGILVTIKDNKDTVEPAELSRIVQIEVAGLTGDITINDLHPAITAEVNHIVSK